MPWQEVSIMEQRREFVRLALHGGANRRFGIHPDTGNKWLERWRAGERELADREPVAQQRGHGGARARSA